MRKGFRQVWRVLSFRRTKDSIVNLVKWAPIIWCDRDWDQYYFFEMLRFKLENMEKFFKSDKALSVESKKSAVEMKKCVNLLDRIIKDNYAEYEYEKHDKKWGEFFFKKVENRRGSILTRANVTPETEEKERKEFLSIAEKEDYLRKQDISYLFHLLNKHILTWWD